jgi:DNA-binding NarL/FixJ family response regulator
LTRTRTLLIGGHAALLDGIVDWVANDPQFEIVGRVHSGSAAIERIDALRAELVLINVSLPDMNGFEVVRRIKTRADSPLVVLLSFHDSQAARLEGWAAGADGFVPLSETTSVLTPLVGDLLRKRDSGVGKEGAVPPSKRVTPPDVSE